MTIYLHNKSFFTNAEFNGISSACFRNEILHLELKIITNIIVSVICAYMVNFHRSGHINNVTVCYNGNRQIPTYIQYVHSSNHTYVYCVSMHGIAFCSHWVCMPQTCCTCAAHVFHVCHVKLLGNLYCSYIHT